MTDQNRRIMVEIAGDGAKAFVTYASMPEGESPDISWIKKELSDRGIVKGLKEATLKELASALAVNPVFKGRLLVAEGKAPQDGSEGRIDVLVKPGQVVRPGALLAKRIPPAKGEHGYNVRGREILAKRGREAAFPEGKNTVFANRNEELRSACYGTVDISETELSVHVPVKVSENKFTVFLDVHPGDSKDPVSVDDISRTLKAMGFKGTLQEEDVEKALAKDDISLEVPVLKGKPPQKGDAARYKWKGKNGDIVLKGEKIAEILPKGPGVPGTDVYGKPIKPEEGEGIGDFKLDRNLVKDDRGRHLQSMMYGRLRITDEEARIDDVLEVEEDEYSAVMDISGKGVSGKTLKPEMIREHLKKAKVVQGFDLEAVEDAIRKSRKNKSIMKKIVVARGSPVVHGSDTQVEFKFQVNGKRPDHLDRNEEHVRRDFILRDRVLAEVTPHVKPEPGITVYGKKVHATPGRALEIDAGENVRADADRTAYRSTTHGFADYTNGKITITPAFRISDDEMSVEMTLYPSNSRKRALTTEVVLRLLRLEKIVYGADRSAIQELINIVENEGKPQTAIIARGREAVDGEDARLEHHISFTKKVGEKRKDGSIDYKERSFIPTVKKGDLVLTKHAPTRGRDGVTVFGKTRAAYSGVDFNFLAGKGVQIVGDDRYYAAMDGVACLTERELQVQEKFTVQGDVDYETGNINFDGSIVISGAVKSGFKVSAKGSVEIMGSVEDAIVEAGANVVVHSGTFHKTKGHIKAGGKVEMLFATNARVEAVDSITVFNDAVNCLFTCEGVIDVFRGKGRVVGGHLKAGKLIQIREFGSDGAVTSKAEIIPPPRLDNKLAEIAKELEGIEKKFEAVTTRLYYLLQPGLENLPPDKKKDAIKLTQAKENMVLNKNKLLKLRESIQAEKENFTSGEIRIVGQIWPAAKVILKNLSFTPSKVLHYTGFKYSKERDAIQRFMLE